MKLMSRCSRHAWVHVMGICIAVFQGIATNSKAIANYTQTVMQLDKAKICIVEMILCCVIKILYFQYSCVVATSFVHTADIWGWKELWLTLNTALTSILHG